MEALKTMRRKINISASNARSPRDQQHSEAFTHWLQKKKVEREELELESDSGESINPTDDEEDDKMYEFNKRVRKQNKPKIKSLTPGNRPVKDIINIGSTTSGESSNPSPYLHANAYWEWNRGRDRQMTPKSIRSLRHRHIDVGEEKRRLEEKRQRLLMSAISYDEWLDHVEDRKMLIKQILQADSAEIEKIEKEKIKDREHKERMFSYGVWQEKIKQRNIEEKKRREKQRRYEEANQLERLQSSAAVQFEAWLERKRNETQKGRESAPSSDKGGKKQPADPAEAESAYEAWLLRKHNEDMVTINKQIEKERELLGAMRQMRASAITT